MRYELWQNGEFAAGSESSDGIVAWQEIMHYAVIYLQDGPVEIREIQPKENGPAKLP